jgi:hypothetical protein
MPRRRLKTMRDIARYVTNLINRIESGEIDPQDVQKIGFMLNILIKCADKSILEERVETLETKLEEVLRLNNLIMYNSGIPGEIDPDDYAQRNQKKAQ